MKRTGKFVALVLTVVMALSSVLCVPATALFEDGIDVVSTQSFYDTLDKIDSFVFSIFGFHIIKQKNVEVELDKEIADACAFIAENSGLDPAMIVQNFPSFTEEYLSVAKGLNIDVAKLHQQINSLSDKVYADGYVELSFAVDFIAMLSGGVEKLTVLCLPTGNDNIYELAVRIDYSDSTSEQLSSGVYLDVETQQLYGNKGKGMLDQGYDLDIGALMIYVPVNVWMRKFGFTSLYDFCAYVTPFFNYTTERVKFEYDNRDWMVQLWKGRYVIANGAEIGIYSKPKDRGYDFYDCAGDEDMLDMSMTLSKGDNVLLKRDEVKHWWLAGFALGKKVYLPSTLTISATITLKDEDMLNAFCAALDGFDKITYDVDGLRVSLVW